MENIVLVISFLCILAVAIHNCQASVGNKNNYNATVNSFVTKLKSTTKTKRSTSSEFPVCPFSHQYAYSNGDYCCKTREEKSEGKTSCDGKDFKRSSTCCKNDDYIKCPENSGCEDYRSPCVSDWDLAVKRTRYSETVTGHDFEDDRYNQHFDLSLFDLDDAVFVHNRPVYIGSDHPDLCIWWHKQYRHWWMGSCQYVGDNQGYAYLATDETCPYFIEQSGNKRQWKRGGNNNNLRGYTSYTSYSSVVAKFDGTQEKFDGKPTPKLSATGGTGSRVFRGRWRQTCKWKFLGGRFRCLKA